jgi:hypothetical protein
MNLNNPEMRNLVNEALNKIKDDDLSFYFNKKVIEDAFKGKKYAMSMVSDLLLYTGKLEEAHIWRNEAIKK